MFSKKISIVLLTYYHEDYISRALESILAQKINESYEIYIADDCSQDRTIAICEKYKEKYPDIIFLHKNEENQGICKNVINALQACQGEYIMITDGDDYWTTEDKLSKQLRFLENNHDYIAVATAVEARDTKGKLTGFTAPDKKYRGMEITREMFLRGVSYSSVGMLMRNIFSLPKAKEQFENIYKFSRDLDDLPLCVFLFDYGKIYNMEEITYAITHRSNEDVNQHNYNTKYNQIQKNKIFIDVSYELYKYYDRKLDLTHLVEGCVLSLTKAFICLWDVEILKTLNKVPLKYKLKAFIRYPLRKLKIIEY